MNGQFDKLVEQAEEYAAKNSTGDWEVGPAYQDLFNKKFAELIVRECISTLEEKIYSSIDNEGDEIWADLILKEHFGVEE